MPTLVKNLPPLRRSYAGRTDIHEADRELARKNPAMWVLLDHKFKGQSSHTAAYRMRKTSCWKHFKIVSRVQNGHGRVYIQYQP